MKKLIVLIVSLVVSVSCFGQKMFVCDKVLNDFDKWQSIAKEYKQKGNKKWSKEIMKTWP